MPSKFRPEPNDDDDDGDDSGTGRDIGGCTRLPDGDGPIDNPFLWD